MGAEKLQGTPWHPNQLHKTCKKGSKYCIYNNNNNCSCTSSIYYHTACVGKGDCEEFESRGNMAKTTSEKTIIIKQNPHNSKQPTEEMFSRPSLITKHYKTSSNSQIPKKKQEDISMQQSNEIENKTKEVSKETPKEKFLRLSLSRVNNIIDDIRLLGKLSNTTNYEYTDEQVEKMFSHIESVLQDTKDSFNKKQPVQEFKW